MSSLKIQIVPLYMPHLLNPRCCSQMSNRTLTFVVPINVCLCSLGNDNFTINNLCPILCMK